MRICCLRCALLQFGNNRGSPLHPSTFPPPQVIDKINEEIEELDEQLNESVQQAMRDKLREKVGVRGGGEYGGTSCAIWGLRGVSVPLPSVRGREVGQIAGSGPSPLALPPTWPDSVVRAKPPRPSSHMARQRGPGRAPSPFLPHGCLSAFLHSSTAASHMSA